MVPTVRAVHTLMVHKRKPKMYTLSNGKEVNCREVAEQLDITEVAARYRLKKSDDPKVIYRPYNKKTGGKKRVVDRHIGTKKNLEHEATEDEKLWKLVMKMGANK